MKKDLWLIVAITVFNAVGLTIVLPLFPFLLGDYLPASQVVIGLSILVSVYAVCQFLAAPVLGAISDRFGRRPVLVISLFGSVIGYFLLGIGGALWVLFLGRVIDGLTAGNVSTLFAYVADVTDKRERTKWYGYMGAANGLGFMIGPAIGGFLGAISFTLPFYIAAVIILVTTLCAYFFLAESLPIEKRSRHFSAKHLNTFAHFKDILTLKEARMFLIIGAFFYIGLSLYQLNISIFLKDVFAWGPAAVGGILTLVGACDIISRSFLLPRLLKKFSERDIAAVGLVGLMLGCILIFLSIYIPSSILIIAGVAFITLGEGLFDPPYNSMLSKSVEESKQGKLQGASQSLQAGYRAIVPLVGGAIYFYSHNAVYALAALLLLWNLVLFLKSVPAVQVAERKI